MDAALAHRSIHDYDANAALQLAANIVEAAMVREPIGAMESNLNAGMISFTPHFASGRAGRAPDMDILIEDLLFGAHYHALREIFYYSYNAPDAVDWQFDGDRVEIRYRDRSILRQFFTDWNEYVLGSVHHFAEFDVSHDIRKLLRGQREWTRSMAQIEATRLMEEEVDWTLAAYFSILDPEVPIDLGGYSYPEFLEIYRALKVTSLYHRYEAEVNRAIGCISMDASSLEENLCKRTGVKREIVQRILGDLVYDEAATCDRLDSRCFSLIREGASPHRIVMRPFHFSFGEGIIQLLRVVARRRPQIFLANVSNALGDRFVDRAKQAFEAQGFDCHANLSLRKIDPTLPDIDLLVISEEPTLGYALIVCEVKGPVPPIGAKDQLRAREPGNISKSFRQTEAIRAFIRTEEGRRFFASLLPKDGHPHFDKFVILFWQLIITSDNAGMFFSHEKTPIMSFRTLERLLHRSDGDMLHVLTGIQTYNQGVDSCLQTTMQTVEVEGLSISYEHMLVGDLLDFPENEWRSNGVREEIAQEFIAEGYHPLDTFSGATRLDHMTIEILPDQK
ncbi:MAG: hypothetical protein J7498_08975 [Sphingobium sp.]|nr:hypothetical protein [Sphingobium sp.]